LLKIAPAKNLQVIIACYNWVDISATNYQCKKAGAMLLVVKTLIISFGFGE